MILILIDNYYPFKPNLLLSTFIIDILFIFSMCETKKIEYEEIFPS